MPVKDIPLSLIDDPPEDLRYWRSPEFKEALKEDIEREGLLVYPIVRPKAGDRFEIIDGVTRIEALRKLGADRVPCDVRDLSDVEALIVGLKVGLRRKSLDPMGLARAFLRLRDVYKMSQKEICDRFNFSKPHVSKLLALNRLNPEDQLSLAQGSLTIDQAYSLVKHKAPPDREPIPISPEDLVEEPKLVKCEICLKAHEFHEFELTRLCSDCKRLLMRLLAEMEKEAREKLRKDEAQRKLSPS